MQAYAYDKQQSELACQFKGPAIKRLLYTFVVSLT